MPRTTCLLFALAWTSMGCPADSREAGDDGASSECVPYADDCPEGSSCQYANGRAACMTAGVIARDEPCDDEPCVRGSLCMPGSAVSLGKSCQQPCDLESQDALPCDIARHTCFPAVDEAGRTLSFGLCRYVE